MDWKSEEGLRHIAQEGINYLNLTTGAEHEDMSAVCNKLSLMIEYLGTISMGKVTSLGMLQRARVEALDSISDEKYAKFSKTIQNNYIDGKCASLLSLFELFKSLENDYSTAIDAYRSIVSLRKTEIEKGLK